MLKLQDSHARPITYLRLSVTDRCQFRCLYCVPQEGLNQLPQKEFMTAAEMSQLVMALAAMGVWRLRLTGGEPLLRPDILTLTARLANISGISDLALSTNGEFLARLAKDLKRAGLQRVNISLDSLNAQRFAQLTHSTAFDKVWQGIHAALDVGLKVKLNVVALKGTSETEIDGLAELAYNKPLEVRFIEFMPLGGTAWNPDLLLPIDFVRSHIQKNYTLSPRARGSEVAESYDLVGGQGRIGYIASMTEPFCRSCSRLRISATGKIQLCLFANQQYDLLPSLRRGAPITELQEEIQNIVLHKPAQHPYSGDAIRKEQPAHGHMRAIGG